MSFASQRFWGKKVAPQDIAFQENAKQDPGCRADGGALSGPSLLQGKHNAIVRQAVLLVLYTVSLTLSLWLSYELRFDFNVPREFIEHLVFILVLVIGVKLLALVAFGQFGSLLSYFSVWDVQKIFFAMLVSALAALGVREIAGISWAPPRAVIIADLMISFLGICSLRMGFRLMREGYFRNGTNDGAPRRRVGVIGAGDAGASLVKDLLVRRGLGLMPVAFFDDDRRKWRTSIHGVSVVGAPEGIPEFIAKAKLDEIVIAMPSATGKRIKEIVLLLSRAGIKPQIVPSFEQLLTGEVHLSQLRPIEIHDLLGRAPVDLEASRISRLVQTRVVMVTGAGGSIGSELCRQIAAYGPYRLLLVERCEVQLFLVEQELRSLGHGDKIVPLVADILDPRRMREIFERFHVNLVFHAAAHKHVPLMESQPHEAFRNNVVGTKLIADLSRDFHVDRLVLISSDKAINPTSVMGATKRLAELYAQVLQASSGTGTKFMAVRFGNVLGSSGSVIPTFKRQIAAGGPVTVTHPDVTRYFMTVHEAVGLVLQSATQGAGGEIFVLDMGQPIKIVDLARQLIELSGMQPDIDIAIEFSGLRPGEKLFEELNHHSENMTPTDHGKIMRFVGRPAALATFEADLRKLEEAAGSLDGDHLKREIQRLIPEYTPHLGPS